MTMTAPDEHTQPGPYAHAAGAYWQAVDYSGGGDDCWPWRAGKSNGYGRLSLGSGKYIYAHRLAVIYDGRELPDDMTVDHLCRSRSCVNPTHLEVVTNAENIRRASAVKQQCPSGHPYDDENTYLSPQGHRTCRTCRRDRQRADYAANPEKYRSRSRENYRAVRGEVA